MVELSNLLGLLWGGASQSWVYTDNSHSEDTPTAEEIKEFEDKYNLWIQQESQIKNQLWSTIPARLQLLVQNYDTGYEIWNAICYNNKNKSELAKADLWRKLQTMVCGDDDSIRGHITEMLRLREMLASCGGATSRYWVQFLPNYIPAKPISDNFNFCHCERYGNKHPDYSGDTNASNRTRRRFWSVSNRESK